LVQPLPFQSIPDYRKVSPHQGSIGAQQHGRRAPPDAEINSSNRTDRLILNLILYNNMSVILLAMFHELKVSNFPPLKELKVIVWWIQKNRQLFMLLKR